MTRTVFPAALLGVLLVTPLAGQHAEAGAPTDGAARTTQVGVFTAEQAARGQATFRATCAACHSSGEFGSDSFMRRWSGRTLHDFYDLISTSMPMDRPGALSVEQYVDIVAYVLELNGMPAAETPLPADPEALGMIRIAADSTGSR